MMNNRLEIGSKNRCAHKMVNGNIKKSLNLRRMKIHCKNSVRTGGGKHICNYLCGNRISCFCFSVLTGISEIRDNRRYSSGGGTAESVYHYDKLHKIVIYRIAGGLNDKHIGAANGFLRRNTDLAVGKVPDGAFSKRKTKVSCYVLRRLRVCVAGENFNVLPVDIHFYSLLLTHGVFIFKLFAL